MSKIEFFISCIPSNSSHQGSLRIITPKGKKPFVGKYKKSKAKVWEQEMMVLFQEYAPEKPMEGPISMEVAWVFPWRKNEKKKNMEAGYRPKDTRSDLDNLVKGVADVCTRLGFYKDDSQIWRLMLKKFWGDNPGIAVRISEFEEGEE